MQTLAEIFNEIGNNTGKDIGCNDKGGIHTYLETYDRLFLPFQKGCTMLEVGLAMGDSIALWDRYFENSTIIGIDLSIVFPKRKYKNNVYFIEGDATKENDILDDVEFLELDIVIDDGSHVTQDQIDTFEILKHQMKKGGLYILEDVLALDQERKKYLALHDNCEIIDMRQVNGRFDNVLIIFRF